MLGSTLLSRAAGPPAGYRRSASWEDPALLELLALPPGARTLCFEPSGDDALTLAAAGCAVHAVLPEPGARARVALAVAAARALPLQSVRSLWGLAHFGRRIWFLHYVRPGLPDEARAWWDAREAVVREGLADSGELEQAARRLGRALGASALRRSVVAAALAPAVARLADAETGNAAKTLLQRLDVGGPFAAWLLGVPDAELPRPWLTAPGLRTLTAAPPAVVDATREQLLTRSPEPYDAVILGRSSLSREEDAALASSLAPGGVALGWGPPPSAVALDASATDAARRADRGLFPGQPWVARRP